MENNKLFEIIDIARDGIDANEYRDIYSFKADLKRRSIEADDTLIECVWKQAWHEHVKKIRHYIELRVEFAVRYYCKDHVGEGKELSEEEFDEILKDNGLMRIKS